MLDFRVQTLGLPENRFRELGREEFHVSVRLPMSIHFLQQLPDARIVCCYDYFLWSQASRTLNMANCLLWQLSVPAASTLFMRLLTQCALCSFLVCLIKRVPSGACRISVSLWTAWRAAQLRLHGPELGT